MGHLGRLHVSLPRRVCLHGQARRFDGHARYRGIRGARPRRPYPPTRAVSLLPRSQLIGRGIGARSADRSASARCWQYRRLQDSGQASPNGYQNRRRCVCDAMVAAAFASVSADRGMGVGRLRAGVVHLVQEGPVRGRAWRRRRSRGSAVARPTRRGAEATQDWPERHADWRGHHLRPWRCGRGAPGKGGDGGAPADGSTGAVRALTVAHGDGGGVRRRATSVARPRRAAAGGQRRWPRGLTPVRTAATRCRRWEGAYGGYRSRAYCTWCRG